MCPPNTTRTTAASSARGVFRKDITGFFGTLQTLATEEILDDFGLDPALRRLAAQHDDQLRRRPRLRRRIQRPPVARAARQVRSLLHRLRQRHEAPAQGSRTADFNRFIPRSANWGVTFTKNPITFMAKWHHRGEQNRGPSTAQGPFAFAYQDARTTLDVNLTYQAFKRLSVFVNGHAT